LSLSSDLPADGFSLKLALFLGGLAVLLLLVALVVRWWGRIYQETEAGRGGLARRVLKNSLTPLIARLINRAVDFAFAIVVLHYLGVEGYGAYAIAALLVGQYLTTVADFGLSTLSTREVAREPEAANRYLSNTTLLRWALSALSLPLCALIIFIYSRTPQPLSVEAQAALWLLAAGLFPAGLAAAVSALFTARERLEVPALAGLLTNILKVFAGVGVLVAGWGVVGLAASSLLVTLANAVLFLYLQCRFLFVPRLEVDLALWRWMVPEALPLMLNNLLVLIFFRFDTFILQPYGGARTVGAYDAAYKLPNALIEVPYFLTMALFPLLSRLAVEDRSRLEHTYHLALKVLLVLAFPLAMMASVLAPEIIFLLGGKEYLPDSAIALSVLIWFLPLSYVNGVTQYLLIALNRQRTITLAFILAALFNVGSNLYWIPRYGPYGYLAASLITIMTEGVLFVPLWAVVRREGLRLPLLGVAWRPALATAVMGVPMVLLHARGLWPVALLVGPALYGAMLLLLRTWTEEERDFFRRLWPWRRRGISE